MTTALKRPAPSVEVLEALGEAVRERAGALLADLVTGLVGPLDDLDALMADGTIYNLDHTPQPNLLGQLMATTAPPGLNRAEQVSWIQNHPRWRRGTVDQIIQAVRDVIGPNKTVEVAEQDPDVDHFKVIVWASEVPANVTADDILAAVLTQKPVGLVAEVIIEQGV